MNPGPPPILRRLLTSVLPPGHVRDGLIGDLDELYAERVQRGRFSADLWYACQLLSAAVHYPPRGFWARRTHGEGTMIARPTKDLSQDPRYTPRCEVRR